MKPVTFTSLSLRNFLSYGNNTTVVELDRPGTTLILGEDLDNTANGQGANGVGKTVIINALAYGVYGKPISNISLDNLVNNINKKNMVVTVNFKHNDHEYQVVRARKTKSYAAGNYVQVYEDGKDITRDSVSNTNTLIEEIIGIPYDLFARIVVFSATHIPFLDLPIRHPTQSCQTAIIEELFDLTTLTSKASELKEFTKSDEQRLLLQKNKLEMLEQEHMRHHEQLKSAKNRVITWETTNIASIEAIKEKLAKLENVDIDEQKSFHEELDGINCEIAATMVDQSKIEKDIKKFTKSKKKAEDDLKHLQDAKCPYCLQQYEDAGAKIEECEHDVNNADDKLVELIEKLGDVDDKLESLTNKQQEVKGKILVQDLEELLEIKAESSNLHAKIEEMENGVNPFIEPLDELEGFKLEPINYDDVNDLVRLIDHQKFLYKLLTKRDSFVRKNLLNKNLPFLNARLSTYLTDLGLPHRVEFTHELTAEISQFGRVLDFGNLSNGQRARVNLALSFAFRDVLERLHTPINVCVLDEVLDVGLDAVGVQNAAKMLKRKARSDEVSLYIISHRDEIDSAFDRNMTIQMSKGFSYVKED